jgi:hypothetical protein
MTSAFVPAESPPLPETSVSGDVTALASHMDDCNRSRGRYFSLRSAGDVVRELVSSRIVSTGALLGAAGLCLLLVLA